MYPETLEEVKNINRRTAVGYGIAMVVAYLLGYGLLIPAAVNSIVKGIEGWHEPLALVGAGKNLYLIESSKRIGRITDSKDDLKVSNISYMTDGGWAKGPVIAKAHYFVPFGDSLLVFAEESISSVEGGEVKGEYSYQPEEKYYNYCGVVSHKGGFAILSKHFYKNLLRFSFFNSELKEEWFFEMGDPIPALKKSNFEHYIGRSYHICSNGEDLYLFLFSESREVFFWKVDIENLKLGPRYSETLGQGIPYDFSMSTIEDRTIFFYDTRETIEEKIVSFRLLELSREGRFSDISILTLPPKEQDRYVLLEPLVSEYKNNIQFIYFDKRSFLAGWMELVDGDWIDMSDKLPKDFNKHEEKMLEMIYADMNAPIQISNLIPLIVPFLVALIAHFHFKSIKNPRVIMGESAGELASMGRRTIAFGIDIFFFTIPVLIATWFTMNDTTNITRTLNGPLTVTPPHYSIFGLMMLASTARMLLGPLYFFSTEAVWGRSLGKAIMGIRVVMADGSRITRKAAATRNALRLVDMMAYYIPVIVSVAATQKYQRIGDIIGKTVVVRDRKGKYMERLGEEELRMERERQAAEQARGVPPGYPPFGPGPYPGAPPGVYYSQITGPASPPGPALPDEPPPLPTPEGGGEEGPESGGDGP